MKKPNRQIFVAGGPLTTEQEDAYIIRSHDHQCFAQLTSDRWVLLLGPRQQGKTSTLIRVRKDLGQAGFATAMIDLQAYGADHGSYADFLRWFSARMCEAFGRTVALPAAIDTDDVECWLRVNYPSSGYVALFVDEVGAVPTPHRTRFFGQLRALYNSRATDEKGVGRRTVIMFAGTFRPETMIESGNSPFNVSVEIRPPDLTREQTLELALRSRSELRTWADRIFDLVAGQPYLTQKYLRVLAQGESEAERRVLWDEVDIATREGTDDRHLASLFKSVLREAPLLTIVSNIISGREIQASAGDGDHIFCTNSWYLSECWRASSNPQRVVQRCRGVDAPTRPND